MSHHQVVWVDIPVRDFNRAETFYTRVLGIKIKREYKDIPLGVFEHAAGAVSACLFESPDAEPSAQGPLIYLRVTQSLEQAAKVVERCGGKILREPHSIGAYGRRLLVLDSEGNRIALHSD